ncbi:MAG TPA: amino acid racemase [Terriglobales bacterium]|nr:amino acid racemase [Terriglobales bacterium]
MVRPAMTQHIGIVACSAEGAALCYRTICEEAQQELGRHYHPEVSVHTHCLGEYMRFAEVDDWDGVAGLMLSSAHKLHKAGADFLICPDNTIHQAMRLVTPKSPLPWLHIAEEVANEARRRGYKRVGLTGTKYLVRSGVYPERLEAAGIGYVRPNAAEREKINDIIFDELVHAIFTTKSLEYFQQVIERMKHEDCDAVVLGCTEIPLLVNDANSPLPTLDSTRLLARAALRRAIVPRMAASPR